MFDAKAVNKIKEMYKTLRWPQLWAAVDADPQLKPIFDTMRTAGWDLTRIVTNMSTLAGTPQQIEQSGYLTRLNSQLAPLAPKITMPGKEATLTTPGTVPFVPEPPSIAPKIPAAVMQTPTNANLNPSGTVKQVAGSNEVGKPPVITPPAQEISPTLRAQTGVGLAPDAKSFQIPAGTQTPKQEVDINNGLNKLFPDVAQRTLQERQLERLPSGQRVADWQGAEATLQKNYEQGKAPSQPIQEKMGLLPYLESSRRRSPFDIRDQILADYKSGKIQPF